MANPYPYAVTLVPPTILPLRGVMYVIRAVVDKHYMTDTTTEVLPVSRIHFALVYAVCPDFLIQMIL